MPSSKDSPISPAIAATRALVDGSRHKVRLSRLGSAKPQIKHEGPASLYVQRAGARVVVVTTADIDWAEASEEDAFFAAPGSMMPDLQAASGTLSFTVEDYLLQILD